MSVFIRDRFQAVRPTDIQIRRASERGPVVAFVGARIAVRVYRRRSCRRLSMRLSIRSRLILKSPTIVWRLGTETI